MASAATSTTNNRRHWKLGTVVKLFWLDFALFIAFILEMSHSFTGLAIHEWLGIAFGIALVYHLLLHWQWIVSVTKRIFGRTSWLQRLKYLVNILLFVDMVIIVATGILISEVAAAQLGLHFDSNHFFRQLHTLAADWAIWLLAIHLGLSWPWIVTQGKRFFIKPITRQHHKKSPQTETGDIS